MIILVITVCLLSVLAVSLFLKEVNQNIFTPHASSLFLWSYIIFSFLGFILISLEISRSANFMGVVVNKYFYESFVYSLLGLFGVMAGYLLSTPFTKINKKSHLSVTWIYILDIFQLIIIFLFIAFIIANLYLYFSNITGTSFPLAQLIIDQQNSNFALSRSESTNAYEYFAFYRLTVNFFLPFLCFYFYLIHKENKNLFYYVLFFLLFILIFLLNSLNLQKGSSLFFLMQFIFLKFAYERRSFDTKLVLLGTIFGFIFITFMIWIISGTSFFSAMQGAFDRIFVGSVEAGYAYVEIFPTHHDFLYGSSFPNPFGVFDREVFQLTTYVSNIIFPNNISLGITGSTPGPFWAEIYANFGNLFIFPFSLFIGLLLAIFDKLIKSESNQPLLPSLIVLIFYFREMTTGGFFSYLIPFELLILILMNYLLIARKSI